MTQDERVSSREYREIGRVTLSHSVDAIFSEVLRDGEVVGYNLNKWVTTTFYTGFTKGLFIPKDKLQDFLSMFPKG